MLSYEVQNALHQKADKFEIHNLDSKIQSLKNEIRDLSENLRRAENYNSTLREVLVKLCDILSEMNDELFNEFQNIRMSL